MQGSTDFVRRAAERASHQPGFLASVLLPFARANNADDIALADYLDCSLSDLPALLLCRRPVPGPSFYADVEQIAARFGLDPAWLAEVIRLANLAMEERL